MENNIKKDEPEVLVKAAKGSSILVIQSIANAILGTILFMFMARILTQTEMGIFGAITVFYNIIILIGVLGMDDAASRFLPYFHSDGYQSNTRHVAKIITLLSFLSAVIISLFFFALSCPLSEIILGTPEYTFLFQITAPLVLVSILAFTSKGLLQGLHRFKFLAFSRLISQIIRVISSLALLFMGMGVASIVIGWSFMFIIMIILSIPIVYKALFQGSNEHVHKQDDLISTKSILWFALPMMGYRFAEFAANSLDQLIVLNILGVPALGMYTVAHNAASLISITIALPIMITLIPGMSDIHGKSGEKSVSNAFNQSTHYIGLFFIPASIGLASLSPLVIKILAGTGYDAAVFPLAILSISSLVYGFSILCISALAALGETRKILIAVFASSIIDILAATILTPFFGIIGASLGRAIAYLAMLGFLYYLGSKKMSMKFDKTMIMGSLLSSTLMAFIVYFVAQYTEFRIFLLPLYLILGLIVYLLFLSGLRILSKNDIKFTFKLIPKGDMIFLKISKITNNSQLLSRIIKKILNT